MFFYNIPPLILSLDQRQEYNGSGDHERLITMIRESSETRDC